MSLGQLSHLHSRSSHRIDAARGQTFIASEKPIDRLVLLDISEFNVQQHHGPDKAGELLERRMRQCRVGGQDFQLLLPGRLKDLIRRRIGPYA